MTVIPEVNREAVLSILALEIERAILCGYQIQRRSNVDIISSIVLGKYEIAALVQRVLDDCDKPEEITRRIITGMHKWYRMRWCRKTAMVSVATIIETVLKEDGLS